MLTCIASVLPSIEELSFEDCMVEEGIVRQALYRHSRHHGPLPVLRSVKVEGNELMSD